MRAILSAVALEARLSGDGYLDGVWPAILEKAGPHSALGEALALWAGAASRPLVLLIDEIDALIGDTLLAVLRQLRSGYARRPRRFPQSIVLCGVRDVRDYRIRSSAENAVVLGGSAFNVKRRVVASGRFHAGAGRCAAHAAHRGNRPGMGRRGEGGDLERHPRPTVVGERAGRRSLLPPPRRAATVHGRSARMPYTGPASGSSSAGSCIWTSLRTSLGRSACAGSSNPC